MKQTITTKQIEGLSVPAKERLRDWWRKHHGATIALDYTNGCQWNKPIGSNLVESYYLPYLTIGQMLEFLDEYVSEAKFEDQTHWDLVRWRHGTWSIETGGSEYKELCDCLWEGVSQLLSISQP